MKKRLLLKLGLVALLGLAGLFGQFVACLWWTMPTTGICRGAAKRIQIGMSREQVEAIIHPGTEFTAQLGGGGAMLGGTSEWSSQDGRIKVCFGGDGKIVSKDVEFATETLPEKLRRWFHLD